MSRRQKPRRRTLTAKQVRRILDSLRPKKKQIVIMREVDPADPHDLGPGALFAAGVEMMANDDYGPMAGYLQRLGEKVGDDPGWAKKLQAGIDADEKKGTEP